MNELHKLIKLNALKILPSVIENTFALWILDKFKQLKVIYTPEMIQGRLKIILHNSR